MDECFAASTCWHDPEQGEEDHGDHGGDGERESLSEPVGGHQEDGVGAAQRLARIWAQGEQEERREQKWSQEHHPCSPKYSDEVLQRSL